jgi:hypothetical protein
MQTLFKTIDMNGKYFNFRLKGEEKYKTAFGGLWTLLTIGIFILLTFLLGYDFYFRTNPLISTSYYKPTDYFNYTLNSSSFLFGFRVDDQDGNLVKRPDILYYEPHYIVYKKTPSGGTTKVIDKILEYAPCKPEDLNNNNIYYVQTMQNWFCIKWPEDGLTVGGLYDGDLIQYIKIRLYNCIRNPNLKRDNITCSNDVSELKTLIKSNIYFSVIVQNYLFESNDLVDPFRLGFNNLYDTLDLQIQKKVYYYFKLGSVNDDKGWLFEDRNTTNLIGVDRTKYDLLTAQNDEFHTQYYECNLYFDKIRETFSRRFMKLAEIIANVGGILKSLMTLLTILVFYYNTHYQYQHIQDSCFHFKPDTGAALSNISLPSVNINVNRNNINPVVHSNLQPIRGNNNIIITGLRKPQIRQNLNNLSFVSYLTTKMNLTTGKRNELSMFKNVIEIVNYKIDPTYLLKFMSKTENCLKSVISTETIEEMEQKVPLVKESKNFKNFITDN